MRRRMQPRQLKTLIDSGHYMPQPALVAQAMLSRRSVRELLTGGGEPLNPTDRTRTESETGRQAA
jgi:hypothetical protein